MNNETAKASQKKKLKRVGKDQIEQAKIKLDHYKAAKAHLNSVIRFNENWYRQRHMDYIRAGARRNTALDGDTTPLHDKGELVEPTSAWLFNSIQNFHADYSDNYPRACVLAREKSDEEEAYKITRILPSLLDRIKFEATYSRAGWTKAIQGWAVYTVTWDKEANNSVGEISIGRAKLLNLYWDMEVDELERSSDVFYLHERNRDELIREHPELKDRLMAEDTDHERHEEVVVGDGLSKVTVVDWYYKKRNKNGKKVLHLCQFVGDTVLYATENNPDLAERGLYDHGKYPFIVDVLYPMEDALFGFGKVAVGSSKQGYIDLLSQAVLENALWSSRPRYFAKKGYGFNKNDFMDTRQMLVEVDCNGNMDEALKEIQVSGIDGNVLSLQDRMIEEMRETTNMRDVSQGSTTGGVTAASGIAALQEAAGKMSRDSNRTSFRAFREIVTMIIELIRQFYTDEHFFRVLNQDTGETVYLSMDNSYLKDRGGVLFDLEITTEKSSTYSRMANNELMLSFFNAGIFNPQMADQAKALLTTMDFDKREEILRMVGENDNRQQVLQALIDYTLQIGQAYDQVMAASGVQSNEAQNIAMMAEQILGANYAGKGAESRASVPDMSGESSITQNARKEAASIASPT